MRLINRYVSEVSRRLPLIRGRKDVEDELRSTLEDMLEDRARQAGRPADEAMEIELLREYGEPGKVAATYNAMPYLIGPRIMPFYSMVLKIVLSVVGTVLFILSGVQIAMQSPMSPVEFLKAVGEGLSGLVGALISAFGSMTLVFAILERVMPDEQFKTSDEKEWDPAQLAQEPESDEVKPWEPMLAIFFTAIFLSILNFNQDWIGLYYQVAGKWVVVPVLSEAFFRWLPWINAGLVAEIILNAVLLTTGRQVTATRLFHIAIQLFQIAVGYMLLTGPSILAITPQSLQATGIFDPNSAQVLGRMAQQGVQILIVMIIVLEGVDVVKTVIRMVRNRSFATA